MPGTIELVVVAIVVGAIAATVGFVLGSRTREQRLRQEWSAKGTSAEQIIEDAKTRHREMLLEARDEALRIKTAAEADIRERRVEQQRLERRLQQKEETLDRRIEQIDRRERAVVQKERETEALHGEIAQVKQQAVIELERVSGLTAEEAKSFLVQQVEEEARQDANRRVREVEAEAKEEGERRARKIVTLAIQRCAADQVAESVANVVHLPNDEMKGRIIGREGRNIRALESATGVDVIIDDTPDAVTLSGFDPIRREIARIALQKLIVDGRIHPARIEEVVQKARQELDQILRDEGEQAAIKAGVHGLPPELIKIMGRLKYRTSYGQNVLLHSVEVAHLAAMIASELGADVTVARTAGFLHDIGKAVDHEVEGPHALIGADIVRRFGKSAKIVHAIAAHHNDEEPQTVEPIIISSADAISGARPGARRETVENYIKRLDALEGVANS
ncbi:MAG TPA: ribonuclease Y, partial [Chloroflexota bacterium]|nr:ribonuclease Y [Chloroflexota bacterium]